MPDDVTWRGRAAPPGLRWALVSVLAVLGIAVWLQAWWLAALPVVLSVVHLRNVVDVRIDASGLTVRSVLRRPSLRVEAGDVVRAGSRTHVSPMQDFAGHGWRTSQGGTRGVVVREGEALVVERRDDSPLVITVDDSDAAARALTAVARLARER